MSSIFDAITETDISLCFSAYKELRPHLTDEKTFISRVINQQKTGFMLKFIKETGTAVALAGYRVLETLAWGKIIYIDDLITRESGRGKGYAKLLLKTIMKNYLNT